MFCGGKNCKYEGSANWSEDQQAICGLYSHWYEKWSVICAFIIVVMQSESGQICVCVLIMQLHMEQGKRIFITHKCSCGSALGCICVCVCVCVCLSVCLSVCLVLGLTFESLDLETCYFLCADTSSEYLGQLCMQGSLGEGQGQCHGSKNRIYISITVFNKYLFIYVTVFIWIYTH